MSANVCKIVFVLIFQRQRYRWKKIVVCIEKEPNGRKNYLVTMKSLAEPEEKTKRNSNTMNFSQEEKTMNFLRV